MTQPPANENVHDSSESHDARVQREQATQQVILSRGVLASTADLIARSRMAVAYSRREIDDSRALLDRRANP